MISINLTTMIDFNEAKAKAKKLNEAFGGRDKTSYDFKFLACPAGGCVQISVESIACEENRAEAASMLTYLLIEAF